MMCLKRCRRSAHPRQGIGAAGSQAHSSGYGVYPAARGLFPHDHGGTAPRGKL